MKNLIYILSLGTIQKLLEGEVESEKAEGYVFFVSDSEGGSLILGPDLNLINILIYCVLIHFMFIFNFIRFFLDNL